MNLKARLLNAISQSVAPVSPQAKIFIGFSGGVDSTVLAYALCQLFPERVQSGAVVALHVHHGLQKAADHFESWTQTQAAAWKLDYRSFRVQVNVPPGESIEACARRARYLCLDQCLGPQDILMLAHHQDDQAETFLLQALRGSGVGGLSCMPAVDAQRRYYRPLLGFSKQELEDFAQEEGLSWVTDPTNENTDFDRNFLRNEIFPRLMERFPSAHKTLARAAQNCAAALTELQPQWQEHLSAAVNAAGDVLSLTNISQPIVKAWLDSLRIFISRLQLEQLWQDVVLAREDAEPVFDLGHVEIRRFANSLYCLNKELLAVPPYDLPWTGQSILIIPGWEQALTLSVLYAQGVNVKILEGRTLRVHSRIGGERCHPEGRAHSQMLKKLFQEYQVPPWKRDTWPLVSVEGQVVCVLGLFVCKEFSIY